LPSDSIFGAFSEHGMSIYMRKRKNASKRIIRSIWAFSLFLIFPPSSAILIVNQYGWFWRNGDRERKKNKNDIGILLSNIVLMIIPFWDHFGLLHSWMEFLMLSKV